MYLFGNIRKQKYSEQLKNEENELLVPLSPFDQQSCLRRVRQKDTDAAEDCYGGGDDEDGEYLEQGVQTYVDTPELDNVARVKEILHVHVFGEKNLGCSVQTAPTPYEVDTFPHPTHRFAPIIINVSKNEIFTQRSQHTFCIPENSHQCVSS